MYQDQFLQPHAKKTRFRYKLCPSKNSAAALASLWGYRKVKIGNHIDWKNPVGNILRIWVAWHVRRDQALLCPMRLGNIRDLTLKLGCGKTELGSDSELRDKKSEDEVLH